MIIIMIMSSWWRDDDNNYNNIINNIDRQSNEISRRETWHIMYQKYAQTNK